MQNLGFCCFVELLIGLGFMELHQLHHHVHLCGHGGCLPRALSFACSPSFAPIASHLRPNTLNTPCARSRPRSSDPSPDPDIDDNSPFSITLESREQTRRRHWIERDWAPWEEKLNPEMQFAVDSLRQGVDEPVVSKDMFERLSIDEPLFPDNLGSEEVEEDPDEVDAREHGAIPGTDWRQTEVFALIPPRDWPPPGWKVDHDELAFIRGAHSLKNIRVTPEDLKNAKPFNDDEASFDRWNMFIKQYEEWVAANKDRLEREEDEVGDEYYPGRRRTHENYIQGMYELPFIYPGQHYVGEVTCVHLYEGAFVDFGAVHDGWVPIKRNDWYHIREHIKVGKLVQVEVLAKRDPYRFRFPVEMRFVHPNIDHLIFKRFNHPPIIWRDEDTNTDEVTREVGRPYWPMRRPDPVDGEEQLMSRHPFVFKVWQMHMAEQMVLDDEEKDATESGPVSPVVIDEDESKRLYIDEDSYWTEENIKGVAMPSLFLTQHEWELDITGAREERKSIDKARDEAQSRGEEFKAPKLKRDIQMEELDAMHYQRYIDENEALERDKICRLEFGLSLEEPGWYADDSFFGENKYNPREKRWRHDYVGDVTKSKDDGKKERESRPRTAEIALEEEDRVPTSWGGSYTKQEEISPPKSNENEESSVGNPTRSQKSSSSTEAKLVNGTESSKVFDTKSMFKIREEGAEEGETDDSDSLES